MVFPVISSYGDAVVIRNHTNFWHDDKGYIHVKYHPDNVCVTIVGNTKTGYVNGQKFSGVELCDKVQSIFEGFTWDEIAAQVKHYEGITI
jgi:hypothetical protein